MLKVYMQSDIGLVRQTNQDACKSGILPDGSVWVVVCDGMGGANGGNVASSVAVDQIAEHMAASYQEGSANDTVKDLVLSAIMKANNSVHDMASADAELSGMGTTVVASIVAGSVAHIAHAGDSRAYQITAEGIRQLTTDHSMVQEMVNHGDITEQQAKLHPQKNIITRALGIESSIEIDYCEVPFLQGDRLLICTDGLTNYVDEEQVLAASREMSAEALTSQLVELAKKSGGGDNITVAIVEN